MNLKHILLSSVLFVSVFSLNSCGNATNANNNNAVNQPISLTEQVDESYIPSDVFADDGGTQVKVTLVGHGSIMFEYGNQIIHVDPYSAVADYAKLPKADLVMLTHEHADHLDQKALDLTKKESTEYIVSKVCNEILGYGDIMSNGNVNQWNDIIIEAVPAYNIVNKTPSGDHYHPKGRGNGYIFTFGKLKVYVAGDTENIPEMDKLFGTVDIAFLPKNLPYTMTDAMFVDAAKRVNPKVLYPYHMSDFNESDMKEALQDTGIQLLVRPMSNKGN